MCWGDSFFVLMETTFPGLHSFCLPDYLQVASIFLEILNWFLIIFLAKEILLLLPKELSPELKSPLEMEFGLFHVAGLSAAGELG